ncbi:MAG: dihydroorotate dehydrogenase-like protein [Acidobacteria bacterium]|nr:dihydroorotate dehydrogenase-like protein [Acidobacteriota bacterium]
MNLSTKYLGMELPHPFIVGASPLTNTLDGARRVEDAGAAAIVLASLFEEQIRREAGCVPPGSNGVLEGSIPEIHLENLRRLKESLAIPVVASLNGSTLGGWINWATALQEMGADALELNLYEVATDERHSSEHVERVALEIVREVRAAVRIPLAVKLLPYYSSLSSFARQLEDAGADAIVIFNRTFEAEVDIEHFRIESKMTLSSRDELLSRLRWASILAGQLHSASIAVSGGVHEGSDAVKAVACGASVVQVVSALYEKGTAYLRTMRRDFEDWLDCRGFAGVEQLRARLSILTPEGDRGHSRIDYMRMLHDWRPEP